jgi:tetratricopeptide (TPR) repeat protein
MKRILLLSAAIAIAACSLTHPKPKSTDYERPFYGQFLNTGSSLDARIQQTLAGLRANPNSAALHNELGSLLVLKQFPNDAQKEFELAVNADPHFYPAWYNLGLIRESRGQYADARRAFHFAVHYRKGHGPSLFELGLMEERAGNNDAAAAYYAKAFKHNPELIDPKYNPRVLNSRVIDLALIKNYELDESRVGSVYAAAPSDYVQPQERAASKQPAAKDIVTPAPAATDTAGQIKPPTRP